MLQCFQARLCFLLGDKGLWMLPLPSAQAPSFSLGWPQVPWPLPAVLSSLPHPTSPCLFCLLYSRLSLPSASLCRVLCLLPPPPLFPLQSLISSFMLACFVVLTAAAPFLLHA